MILETAVGDDKLTQSFEPQSFLIGGAFTIRECRPRSGNDSDSKSYITLSSRTAVSRMIWALVLLSMLGIVAPIAAAQLPTPIVKLRADQIDFDGVMARLAGNVYLEHVFGVIQCQKAVLLMSQSNQAVPHSPIRGFSPERILLDGDVYVSLRDGSTLTSDEADIDCLALEGVFTANLPNQVLYTTFVQRGLWKSKMNAESKAVRLKMKKIGGKNSQYTFTDLRSEDVVHVEYEDQKVLEPPLEPQVKP